ncbi:MAG: zinc metalloprotease HtpX [Streptosporangiaceae bacterium]
MFLLGLVYVGFIGALVARGAVWWAVLIIALCVFAIQYFFSDRLALVVLHGRVVEPEDAPELHSVVDRLCALSDMPKPSVAIAETDIPNAFATGRGADRAVLCVTRGLMRRLEVAELEGVIAHELSHVAHRDVAVMTVASFIGILAGIAMRFGLIAGRRGGGNQGAAMTFGLVTLASVVAYALSFLLIRTLSRYREMAADRAGALLTGRPSSLASALTKLSGQMARIPTRDLRRAEPFNAFFVVPMFGKGFSLSTLFSTHPSLDQRLGQLARISADLGRA